MAISSATAASGASEAGSGAEEDNARDEGIFTDAHSGPDNDGTVLAGANPQLASSDAESTMGQGNIVRPFLVPTKNYPPARSTAAPIDVNQFNHHSPIDINQYDHPTPADDWQLDLKYTYIPSPSPTQSHS